METDYSNKAIGSPVTKTAKRKARRSKSDAGSSEKTTKAKNVKSYSFPAHGVTVQAENLAQAQKKLTKKIKT